MCALFFMYILVLITTYLGGKNVEAHTRFPGQIVGGRATRNRNKNCYRLQFVMAESNGKPVKKARKANFSPSEISVLTDLVEENISTIQSKFTDSVTNRKKNEIWSDITNAVNALGIENRSVKEVKDKWKNLTSQAKKEFSGYGREKQRTGGGPPPKAPTPATAKIIDLFKETPSFTGLAGFESNPGKSRFFCLHPCIQVLYMYNDNTCGVALVFC